MKAVLPTTLSLTTLFLSTYGTQSFDVNEVPLRRSRQHADLARAHKRQAEADPRPLPAGWTNQGCFLDNVGGRSLTGDSFTDPAMTQELCANFCNDKKFAFAGTEFAQECYCDNFLENGGAPAEDSTTCNMACAGNDTQTCGGPNRLTLFFSNVPPPPKPPPPAEVQQHDLWETLGCFSEGNGGRTLPHATDGGFGAANMTIGNCLDSCLALGFPLAGAEFGQECYCGLAFGFDGAPADDGCNMACKGDPTELCGGPNRLNAYNYTGTITITPPPQDGGGGGEAGPLPTPQTTDLIDGWNFIGCYTEGTGTRAMSTQRDDNSSLVPNDCLEFCAERNFTVAGLEFSVQCFCDNLLRAAAAPALLTDCSMGCGGNASVACGAGQRLTIYSTSTTVEVLPVPTAKTTGLPTDWEYQGCLTEPDFPAPRVFPYKTVDTANQTITQCLTLCQKFGFPAAGVEFGDECWCGDIADTDASPGFAPAADCSFPCPGSPTDLCGAGNRLQTYFFKGPALFEWHSPEVTGRYEFLVGGPVVPLVTALGVNNKVTFLEKLGSGPQNSTHAYELDYTLAADATKAFREMHVKTDVFCAGGLVLPDKAARQLSVGGWSLDSTWGVRLYTPDGVLGTNGTNDWEENFQELSLQIGRWYPSSMILSNGSILVIGGERGANDIPEPTIEILPRIPGGPTLLELPFLRELDPNDLYPFVFVLPQTGQLWILGFNEARLLDPVTFDTNVVFPTIPGSVNEVAGRTYPMEGASVMLPLHAPYTDPAEVLTCGGSPGGGGTALDNCVLITPEVEGADWQIERMPFRRVMPCMTALPDGTFLIVNGAQKGVAGFGLANDPTLTALLYDPTLPVGARISILNTTIVARMYHSEAILLHDGRVLITGSDPLTTVLNDDGSINEDLSYPEEYRVEVYIPPYLATGRTQPEFTITNTDWEYGGQYSIVVQLHHGTTATMRVSILGAVVSTHGNNFGQRTLFPEFSCTGTTCKITAPPNNKVFPPGWAQLFVLDGPTPSFSQWIRIGGDPAGLGNWPDLPDFTRPGV